jgi:hypothetical protein
MAALGRLLALVQVEPSRFPAHVLMVPSYIAAGNPERALIPKHDLDASVIDLPNHRDSETEQRHTLTLLEGSPLSAAIVIFFSPLDQAL